MSPEEYERIKEAEKAHLRSLRHLKERARALRRRRSLGGALGRIAGAQHVLDAGDEAADRLARETAHHEARLHVALEGAPDAPEEATRRRRAQELLAQLKAELGVLPPPSNPERRSPESETAADAPPDAAAPPSQPAPRPSKKASEDEKNLPEKTIGRMRGGR